MRSFPSLMSELLYDCAKGSKGALRGLPFLFIPLIHLNRFRYFASRPEILTKGNDNNNNGGQAAATAAAATAAANAVRNAVVKRPEQAAKYMSAGLKHFAGSGGNEKENRPGTTATVGGSGNNSNSNRVSEFLEPRGFSYIFQFNSIRFD